MTEGLTNYGDLSVFYAIFTVKTIDTLWQKENKEISLLLSFIPPLYRVKFLLKKSFASVETFKQLLS